MRHLTLLSLVLILTSCTLVSPYTITFTTQNEQVVDPAVDTLDFVISSAALAYISEIDCDGADEIELLPVVTDEMEVKTAHNLALTALNGAPGSECEITVTAFDQSTTASAQAEIRLVIDGGAVSEPAEETVEESVTEETPVEESSTEEVMTEETPAPEEVPMETPVDVPVEATPSNE